MLHFNMDIWYFKRHDGLLYGPFSAEEMQERVQSGMMAPDTAVRMGDTGQRWYTAEYFQDLFVSEPSIERLIQDAAETGRVSQASEGVAAFLRYMGLCDDEQATLSEQRTSR